MGRGACGVRKAQQILTKAHKSVPAAAHAAENASNSTSQPPLGAAPAGSNKCSALAPTGNEHNVVVPLVL
jgi:hypothetical protein